MRYRLTLRISIVLGISLFLFRPVLAQNNKDSLIIASFYENALRDSTSYRILGHLTREMPGRLCGSQASIDAVHYTAKVMRELGADTVYLQEIMVRNWKRGTKEVAEFMFPGKKTVSLEICSFGMSAPTPAGGMKLKVLEVNGIEELQALPDDSVKGRMVFYNRKMNPANYYTFASYGDIAVFRSKGVEVAARKGAAAIIARSSSLSTDSFPHTGVMRYADGIDSIPALSICTRDADRLSSLVKQYPGGQLFIKTDCRTYPDTVSYNVIAEIRGTVFPDQFIAVGGHIDCWDNSQGAHDDGAGCLHAIEVLRIFRQLQYKPRHTIRIVMFMDEEVAQRGARKYAELAAAKKEKHIAAIESDRGGATPYGFSADMTDSCYTSLQAMITLLKPWGIWQVYKGGSGVDIAPLKPQGVPLMAIVPDSQRYFDYHHCANDTFDKISQRELNLGGASIAALVYLIDTYKWTFKN